MKAVILTAGSGSRMIPLTQYMPKALLPLGMKPSVLFVAQEAVRAGAKKILFICSPDSPLESFFEFYKNYADNPFGEAEFFFHYQPKPLGSGDALLYAEDFCKKDKFFLANCDEIFEKNAMQQLSEMGGLCVGAKKVAQKQRSMYGILHCGTDRIIGVEEKPLKSDGFALASVGRYLLDGRIFDCIKQTSFFKGERRLTDALNILFAKSVVLPCVIKGKRFDVGNPEGYKKAFQYFAFKENG